MKRVLAGEGGTGWCTVMAKLSVFMTVAARQTPAVSTRITRLVSCDKTCVIDPDPVAGLTGGGGPGESLFQALLFCCRGGSEACVPSSGGTRRRCPRANQARG